MYRNSIRKAIGTLAVSAGLALLPQAADAGLLGVKEIKVTSGYPTNEWLHLSELVATQSGTGIDVALSSNGGVGSSFSDYPGTSPAFALDGIYPSSHPNQYHSGSTNIAVEYFDVMLSAPYELDSITIYGRVDCCSYKDIYNLTLFDQSHNVLFASTGADANNANHLVTVVLPNTNTTAVPEPSTLALFGAGLAGLGALRRRRKAKA